MCKANGGYATCGSAKIYNGGVCEANVSIGCVYATIYKGGSCVANYINGCAGTTIDGGKCIANVPGSCSTNYVPVTYTNGGCCEGPYCPASAPKC